MNRGSSSSSSSSSSRCSGTGTGRRAHMSSWKAKAPLTTVPLICIAVRNRPDGVEEEAEQGWSPYKKRVMDLAFLILTLCTRTAWLPGRRDAIRVDPIRDCMERYRRDMAEDVGTPARRPRGKARVGWRGIRSGAETCASGDGRSCVGARWSSKGPSLGDGAVKPAP